MVDTSYGQTFVRISGPVSGPPLVLLPGAGHCSLMWKSNIESLSERHRACAVDTLINTGCVGRSVYTRTIKGPDDAARWLDELFHGLELEGSINLVGMSYGGWLTSQYALCCPERLNRIVLLAPAATVLPVRMEFLLRALLPGLVPLRYFYRLFLRWVFNDLAQEDSEMVADMANHGVVAVRCFKPADYAMYAPPTVLRDEQLQSIRVPALFLVGENEALYSARKAVQRLNEVAPQIQTQVIPNAGHDLTVVQSEMVNQKILEFLAQS
jgi:pimeloyl-ACP methyl ester carboxylesterase